MPLSVTVLADYMPLEIPADTHKALHLVHCVSGGQASVCARLCVAAGADHEDSFYQSRG